jgi:hypothetical protein
MTPDEISATRDIIASALASGIITDPRVIEKAADFLVTGKPRHVIGGDRVGEVGSADEALNDLLWALRATPAHPHYRKILRHSLDALRYYTSPKT